MSSDIVRRAVAAALASSQAATTESRLLRNDLQRAERAQLLLQQQLLAKTR